MIKLPIDIINVIINLKTDIEIYFNHKKKFQKTLDIINNIYYCNINKKNLIQTIRIHKKYMSIYIYNKNKKKLYKCFHIKLL